jgi:hypothetical protein
MTNSYYRIICVLVVLIFGTTLTAQDDIDTPPEDDPANHPRQVFLQRSVDITGIDRLIFVDTLTGDETEIEVYGERYTLVNHAVMFYDLARSRVMLASSDGLLREHPFIQPNIETRRVDWIISDDGSHIAWTLTNTDENGFLTTITTVATVDGDNARRVLTDGPYSDGFRALPLAFNNDMSTLYMDLHLDGLNERMPFNQYVRLFAVDLATGETQSLPGEDTQVCICGADVNAGLFVRLSLSVPQNGFNVYVYDLNGDVQHSIDALGLRGYTNAGDVLISSDGRYAVYALVQINNFGTPQQTTRTVFALVDLSTMTQAVLTSPITTIVRPVRWTEDNTAIIFTSPTQDGTWKIALNDGRLERIAAATFLGTLHNNT